MVDTTKPFVVLTGASGSGKSTIAQAVKVKHPDLADVFFFDSIGVPSEVEMASPLDVEIGPGGQWQRISTIAWICKIAGEGQRSRGVLFEGQMRIAFVEEAADLIGMHHHKIILVDCSDEIRNQRLLYAREQPQLADDDMMNWARYLRQEATVGEYTILDTGVLSVGEAVARIYDELSVR